MTEYKNIRDAMVQEYLTDLEVALAGADPIERAETLASIREHLEESLAADASPEQVRRALKGLGAPGQIALVATQVPAAATEKGVDGLSVILLVGAALALVGIPLGILSFVVAFICLAGAFVDLRTKRGTKSLTWVALVLAAFALVANPLTLSTFLSLLPANGI
ncbi:hypothetical protein V5R04_11975 [Jonesiaceae bacterium BS-20]|uniref:DUF1700 domain-containing protein n=1 Tax=Jonesiaceae bacterium BS-20 TaxID=3120821 RepID=A0AAU7DV33_9MICO